MVTEEIRSSRTKGLPQIESTLVETHVSRENNNVCTIHSIHGGPYLNSESSNAHKRLAKEDRKKVDVRVYSL